MYRTVAVVACVALFCLAVVECGSPHTKHDPTQECVALCKTAKAACEKDSSTPMCENWSKGPCLSDALTFPVKDWVCDIAHSPRNADDNDRANQCDGFHDHTHKHFVEVTPDCTFIQKH